MSLIKLRLTPALCLILPALALAADGEGNSVDQVASNLILFNDNGAWCWYQDPRVLLDPPTGTLLIGSVAAPQGPGGEQRRGNVELVCYDPATGTRRLVVLHERLESDDHDVPALFLRPDGRYLAMYAKHKRDNLSRWRISTNPHDASSWRPEQQFDWAELTGRSNVTYSNLHYLSAEKRLYNFVRAINDDPSIMVSSDDGDTFTYGGKLLTEQKVGYVNGYLRYASNRVDRIDFITTEHHPRDFNNSIYHGYVKGGKLHASDGTVVDENVLDPEGTSQTRLTKVFAADSVVGGETMTHAWTADLQLDSAGHPVALITCRANDVPENSNFNDHRFFYARFDGKQWHTHQIAKAGARLWASEQDYTGVGAIHPRATNLIYISAPIDPRDGSTLRNHEIFKGLTNDGGASWQWTAVTQNSSVDNLRPVVVSWDHRTAVLWFRGTMERSQRYDCAIVGIIESTMEQTGATTFVKVEDASQKSMELRGLSDGMYDIFALFAGSSDHSASIRAGLSEEQMLLFRQRSSQRVEVQGQGALYRGYVGRVQVKGGSNVRVAIDGPVVGLGAMQVYRIDQ
jgi:hypothetical protein